MVCCDNSGLKVTQTRSFKGTKPPRKGEVKRWGVVLLDFPSTRDRAGLLLPWSYRIRQIR